MGWRGALRSIQAAGRAAERDARRRQRQLQLEQRKYERMQALEQAAHDVRVYENYLDRLHSVHKDGTSPVDWKSVAKAPEPQEPVRPSTNEDRARTALATYTPGFMDKLLRLADHKRASLEKKVDRAREHDEVEYQQALGRYQQQHQEWKESHDVAERILNGDPQASVEALQELDPFSELGDLGSKFTFECREPSTIEALMHVHGEKVIPKDCKTLLKSGKLSVKQLPPSKFYDLYQDYVCSCVLRVAREVLAILPVDMVVVTALDALLNTQTGHLEEQPILSAVIPRKTFEALNLDAIDPSDSLGNFVHRMNFKKTTGFSAVERLMPPDLQA